MSNIVRQIGDNIRNIRKSKGLSQEQLALRAEINASYMGQVERGEKNPTIDVLGKIAIALNTPLEKIVSLQTSSPKEEHDSDYAEKISHQLNGLSLKEQEVIYKLVKQMVQFKDL
ncbi:MULTISPECIES: helix-turn-helix domain-containing protein [unclassified Paenibacillus]|uniref:helix-turn-helix domain-containing protein n=1 Tax=unclassified Paenibacillus TaxID=185978 RepID=UPI002F40FB68